MNRKFDQKQQQEEQNPQKYPIKCFYLWYLNYLWSFKVLRLQNSLPINSWEMFKSMEISVEIGYIKKQLDVDF